MEIGALTRIAEAIENGIIPFWLSVVSIGAPIILTILSGILTYRLDKQNKELQKILEEQNKELQKDLHNRDVINQTRQTILNIYNSFLDALNVVEQSDSNIIDIFISQQFIQSWSEEISNSHKSITRSFKQANIILDDTDMIDYLKRCEISFVELSDSVNSYVNTPIPSQIIQNAWNNFQQRYPYNNSLIANNYYLLHQNAVDLEEFKKMCKNSHTDNIQIKVNEFTNLMRDEKFDNYFKKYVQIQKMD